MLTLFQNPEKRRLLTVVLVILVGFISSFFLLNNYIYTQKQADEPAIFTPYEGTLSGEYVCLPHKDKTGPQTEECAFGIQTETDENYAIDFGTQDPTEFVVGVEATLSGRITPIELLSTDHWFKYDVDGIISVE